MKFNWREPLRFLAKPEYPQLYALASIWIATPLIFIGTVVYLQRAIYQSAIIMFPIGLSAFGVTAALSGICFGMARAIDNPYTAKYAGEKFLHSAVLLIQSLLVLYIRDTVLDFEVIKTWPNIALTVKIVADVILGYVTTVAAWTWFHGYEELNKFLWKNWEQRIREINAAATSLKDKGAAVPLPLKVDLTVQTKTPSKDATPT
jgi:hypothetical protein